MRTQTQLRHTRTRLDPRFALFPLEGYPASNLPLWPGVEARILTSPVMGAGFAQYLLKPTAGQGTTQRADGAIETFLYVLSGAADLSVDGGEVQRMDAGGFALVPCTQGFTCTATEASRTAHAAQALRARRRR